MNFAKKGALYLPILLIISLLANADRFLSKKMDAEEGEEPGYFLQWLEEKKAADGTIPQWMYAKWNAWDKANLRSRGSSILIDTVIELGPNKTGGRTRALWIDPRNDNVILAGSVSGGLWRSEDGGTTWKAVNEQETSLSVTCITSSPFNPDIVYYSTGESRGNSSGVGGNGIYKSTDGGKTFSVLPSTVGKAGFDITWKVVHSVTDSNTVYVGTDAQGLFRSIDAGSTWQQVYSGGSKQLTEVLALPNNRVIATTQGSTIVASDSGGKAGTFKAVTFPSQPTSGQYRRVQMSSCRSYPNICYAVFEGYNATSYTDTPARFYKSSDYGRTWVRRASPVAAGSGQMGYCMMIGANPFDSNYVVVAAVYITQTSNGGISWNNKNTGHSDHHGFAGYYSKTTDFLVGTDGGIYRYKWASTSVQGNLNTGYNVTQFYAGNFGPTGMVSISGAQDNGSHVATGKLTSKQFYGADGAFAHIGLQDGLVAYLSTQNEGIRRIDNFNSTIVPSFSSDISDPAFTTDGVDFINAYTINPADEAQLYYRTNKGVYRSNSEGESWTKISNLRTGIKALATSNESDPVLYFGGTSTQLYKIEKASSTSTAGLEINYNNLVPAAVTNDNMKCIAVHPKDKYTIYFALNNFSTQPRIWRASGMDSARPVFKSVSGNLPANLPVNSVAVDPAFPDKNLFAGTDFGLYYSTDSGKTWQKEYRIPNVPVFETKMREDRSLFVYTHGRGMWYISLVGGPLKQNVHTFTGTIKTYPNPASNTLQVALPSNINSAEFTIFDLNARKVLTGTISNTTSEISVAALQNGYYFISLQSEKSTYTSKILVRH